MISESDSALRVCNSVVNAKLDNIDMSIFLRNSCFEIPEYVHIENEDKIIVIDYISSVRVDNCDSVIIREDMRRKFVVRSNIKTSTEIRDILEDIKISDEMVRIIEEICEYQMVPNRTLKSMKYLESNGSNHEMEISA